MSRDEAVKLMGFKQLNELADFLGVSSPALSDWNPESIPPKHELTIRKHLEENKGRKKK